MKKILIIFLPIFLLLISSSSARAADQSVLRLIVGSGVKPTQACLDNPAKCLRDDFNIIVQGNPPKAYLQDVYKIYLEASAAPKYKQLLRSSGPTRLEFISTGEGGCPATVQSNGDGTSTLTLRSYSLSCASNSERKARLVHESGHIIRNGHMRLFQQFESQAYNKDKNCYTFASGLFPPYFFYTYDTSYARSLGRNISGSNESMAEFMADQIVSQGSRSCPIGENWVKNNIFGGYSFK